MDGRLEDLAVDRLLQLAVLIDDDMTRGLAAVGLTTPRAHVLWVLRAGGPSTQQGLAAALSVTPRNITGLVDGLAADGFVERCPHPTDRRAVSVRLTDRGEQVTADLAAGQRELSATLFGGIDEARLTVFLEVGGLVVERLTAAIAADSATPVPPVADGPAE